MSYTVCSTPSTLCITPTTPWSAPSTLCGTPSTLCSTPSTLTGSHTTRLWGGGGGRSALCSESSVRLACGWRCGHRTSSSLVPCVAPLVPCVVPLVPCVVPLVPCVAPLVPCVVAVLVSDEQFPSLLRCRSHPSTLHQDVP